MFEWIRQFWNLPPDWIVLLWLDVLWSEFLPCFESSVYLCDTLFKQKNAKSDFILYVTLKSRSFIWTRGDYSVEKLRVSFQIAIYRKKFLYFFFFFFFTFLGSNLSSLKHRWFTAIHVRFGPVRIQWFPESCVFYCLVFTCGKQI